MNSSNSHKSSQRQSLRASLWRTRSHIKAEGSSWEWAHAVGSRGAGFVGGGSKRGEVSCGSPRGHVFSPSPVLLQLVHSLKTSHHPSPLFLLPPCLLALKLEVHLLCLISPLAIGYVYHQYTIFVAEVCMPHLGKAYQFQMGLSQTGICDLGSLSSLWNPIIHLISICSFHYRQNLCIPSHPF